MSRESIRRDLDNAAGVAFLPEGWQRLAAVIEPLLAVADAAADFIEHEVGWDDRGNPHYIFTGIDGDAAIRLRLAIDALDALP